MNLIMLMESRIIWFRYRDTQTREHNFTTLSADSRHGSAIPVSFLYEIFHHTCTCILVYIVINACVLRFTVKGANSVRPVVSRPASRACRSSHIYLRVSAHTSSLTTYAGNFPRSHSTSSPLSVGCPHRRCHALQQSQRQRFHGALPWWVPA